MRDRLKELLPLLLVAAVLLVLYLTRTQGPALSFLPLPSNPPTPVPAALPEPRRAPAATLTVALCDPAQPRFVGGMATLRAQLGSAMGDALECERASDGRGNTQQQTTTGLAYYRRLTGLVCFTTGWDHWAMSKDGGMLHWVGDSIDPPPDATQFNRR